MRLIYNRQYETIDSNMSECNIGGRKGRGCRDNIFIINAIIHDANSSVRKRTVRLQIYDYSQMFDAIYLPEAICDMFDVGVRDDMLGLLYQSNKQVFTAVNTAYGITDRQTITSSVLQGDTWGTSFASVQTDFIGKEAEEAGYGSYRYKDKVPVTVLGLVDDMIGVTYAGYEAHQLNAHMNLKSAIKRLQFNTDKCKTMTVGRKIVC